MVLETAKNQICINQLVAQKKETICAEGDVIVNDVKPDVLNIISSNGVVCVYKKEVMDGKIRIDGTVNTYIIYLADDENGSVRTLNTNLDFTQFIDMENCRTNMTLDEDISIKNFEWKILNGRKINIKAYIDINARVYSNDSFEIITNLNNDDDIQVLNSNERIISLVGEGKNKTYAKDTISLDEADDLAEIMKVDVKIINEDIKTSYNKILSKADADVSIMFLTEDNRIKNVRTLIPIMGFVDMPNINENCMSQAKNRLKNIVIKPNNIDEHSIYIEAEIELTCYAYETKDFDIIEDLYSLTSNMNFKTHKINAMTDKKSSKEICNIREELNIPELQNEKVYAVTTSPTIIKQTIRKDRIIYEGEIAIEVLFNNNNITSTNITLPLNFEANISDVSEDSKVETAIQIRNEDLIVRENGNATINIELEFNIQSVNTKQINVINEISIEEQTQDDIYSMVIYFVKPGDTLWKIAKRFKSKIDDIARINNIENNNTINPGQQLYIPKFSRRNIAV